MSIFTNIHKLASSIIPRQTIVWRKAGSRTISTSGRAVPTYGDWTSIRATVEPGIISSFGGKNISEKDYKDLGLDFSHNYFTVWTDDIGIGTVAHQDTADQVKIGDRIFNVIQCENWIDFSGWKRLYCEEAIP